MKIYSLFTPLVFLASLGTFETVRALLCADNKDYKFNNKKKRTCAKWVSKKPKMRCMLGDGEVKDACKFTCRKFGGCACADDPEFVLRRPFQTCKWVSKNPEVRCKKGIKIDGVKNTVRDHCRVVCDTCDPGPGCMDQKITAQKFDDSGMVVDDRQDSSVFGNSFAISDNTMAIGAYGSSSVMSALYVYRKNSSDMSYELEKKIEAADGALKDQFGWTVAMSTDTIVVGAVSDDIYKGSAYVIERDADGAWAESQKLIDTGGGMMARFGASVAISKDNVIVVAAYTGGLFFFERLMGTWELTQNVENVVSSFFGISVAINNEFVVTTARNGEQCILFIYSRAIDGKWIELEFEILGDFPLKDYGPEVALSKDTIVIGIQNGYDGNNVQTGVVHIFTKTDGGERTWEKTQTLLAGDLQADDRFGSSVAITGNSLVVGAEQDSNNSRYAGAAYFFSRKDGSEWKEVKKMVAEDGTGGDYFGNSVSVSGTTAIIGSNRDDGFQGAVYVDCVDT